MVTIRRGAFTLLELLLVIAISGLLLALVFSSLIRVRESALRLQSNNNLRQIILAVHQYGNDHHGNLPTTGDIRLPPPDPDPLVAEPDIYQPALFVRILPYIDQASIAGKDPYPPVGLYVSPADPTAQGVLNQGISSYAANARVFNMNPRLPFTFADGTSNTIAFAEHYSKCGQTTFMYWHSNSFGGRASFADIGEIGPVDPNYTGLRPLPKPPVTGGDPDFPYLTYQVAPPLSQCNSLMAQTPHPSGMLVALGDGSVRQISPGISPNTFWGAVTPDGGEVLGADWE